MNNINVHDKELRVVLEQSASRKRDYAQLATAKDLIGSDNFVPLAKIVLCERSFRMYSGGSWEVLGRPSEEGWRWDVAAFLRAGLPLHAFLRSSRSPEADGDAQQPPQQQGAKRRLAESVGAEDEGAEGYGRVENLAQTEDEATQAAAAPEEGDAGGAEAAGVVDADMGGGAEDDDGGKHC